MKTTYSIFRKGWVLNTVAVLMMLFTLQMIVVGLLGIAAQGIRYFSNGNWIILPFFFIYLLLDIWILTATFLPIIKINEDGIAAHSLFWKRKIKWQEIKATNLLKTKTLGSRRGPIGRSSISFETTTVPKNKSFFANKGLIVQTFIVISKTAFINPPSLALGSQLLTHSKITTTQDIAFQYDQKMWQIIQQKVNDQSKTSTKVF